MPPRVRKAAVREKLSGVDVNFPSNWPDNCPPEEAVEASGAVFRIVGASPPGPDDFKSHEELGLPGGSPCRRVAVSVYKTLAHAQHRARLSPNLGTHIVEGAFEPGSGKTRLTHPASGHHAWWSPDEFDRASIFAGPCTPCESEGGA